MRVTVSLSPEWFPSVKTFQYESSVYDGCMLGHCHLEDDSMILDRQQIKERKEKHILQGDIFGVISVFLFSFFHQNKTQEANNYFANDWFCLHVC